MLILIIVNFHFVRVSIKMFHIQVKLITLNLLMAPKILVIFFLILHNYYLSKSISMVFTLYYLHNPPNNPNKIPSFS